MSVYLDYNATTPIDERVLNVMIDVYKNAVGNADSRTHDYGENTRQVVENARKKVASLLGVDTGEVVFTSGATESNNIAIQGLDDYAQKTGKKHIITSSIEHKAVLETTKSLQARGYDVEYVAPDLSGRVSAEKIKQLVRKDTLLVSLMHVNNETGIIQPIQEIGEFLENQGILFHVDATQSCGKLVDELRELKYNILSFSAHKLQGPQGIGALILRRQAYRLPPVKNIMYGGQQELGIRPGTTPVALVAGVGEACRIAQEEYEKNADQAKEIKKGILQVLEESGLKYHVNGDQRFCVDTTINICIEGVSSEALMISTKQYCSISNCSACTSKSYAPSYVLMAMGIPIDDIESSVRISWGAGSNKNAIFKNFNGLIEMAKQFQE